MHRRHLSTRAWTARRAYDGAGSGSPAQEGDMKGRRDFLRQVVPAAAVGVAALKRDWLERTLSASAAVADRPAAEVAADEGYWREIQQAFTLDRTIINLNNGDRKSTRLNSSHIPLSRM